MNIKRFSSVEAFVDAGVSKLKTICEQSQSNGGRCFVALPGGTTPKPLYEALATSDLPFEHIAWFISDERYAPHDHDDSNFNLINKTLIEKSGGRVNMVHDFDTTKPIDEACALYAEELKHIPDQSFDLLVLGVGVDGHTMSLMPGDDVHITSFTAHTTTDSYSVHDRLTIGPMFIEKAKHILVILSGSHKEHIVEALEKGEISPEEMPIMLIKDHPSVAIHFLEA